MTPSSPSTRKPALASPFHVEIQQPEQEPSPSSSYSIELPAEPTEPLGDENGSGSFGAEDRVSAPAAAKRRERPAVLDFSPRHERADADNEIVRSRTQPTLNISHPTPEKPSAEGGYNHHHQSRAPSSASSSALDYYYQSYGNDDNAQPPPPLPSSSSPPLENAPLNVPPKTPDFLTTTTPPISSHRFDPQTPARDPSAIDRRGLIGVGELATPRWVQSISSRKNWGGKGESVQEEPVEYFSAEQPTSESSMPNSPPWTTDAGEVDSPQISPKLADESQPSFSAAMSNPVQATRPPLAARVLRNKASINDESGGEEILYKPPIPRKAPPPPLPTTDLSQYTFGHSESSSHRHAHSQSLANGLHDPSTPSSPAVVHPPSSYGTEPRRARKRTSDEFALDQGVIVPKTAIGVSSGMDPAGAERDDKYGRKHRSLGVGAVPSRENREHRERERTRDKRRGDSIVGLGLGSPTTATTNAAAIAVSKSTSSVPSSRDRHTRHMSASAATALADASGAPGLLGSNQPTEKRRVHTAHADFSHLPPSPSSNTFKHVVHGASNVPTTPSAASSGHHHSPSVGHALLRGNQEGWAGLDDSQTAEALRRLDGVGSSAKVRNRMSTRSGGGSSAGGSRPPSPGTKHSSGQWDGNETQPSKKSRASVGNKEQLIAKASSSSLKVDGKERSATEELADLVLNPNGDEVWGSQQPNPHSNAPIPPVPHSAPSHTHLSHRKSLNGKDGVPTSGQRASYGIGPKRGSASSASFTGTPTSGSRDSTALSSTTSNTSVSLSQRHSYGKMRRNSAGSDISSVHSSDANALKDRAAALAGSHDLDDEAAQIPPVPPLPKDLSNYKSPLPSSTAMTFSPSVHKQAHEPHSYHHEDADRTVIIPSIDVAQSPPKPIPPQPKTPSKKWSFSGLSLHLPGTGHKEARGAASSSASPSHGGASPRSSRSIPTAVQQQGDHSHQHANEHGMYRHPDAANSKQSSEIWSPPMLSPDMPSANDAYYASPQMVGGMLRGSSRSPERGSIAARTPDGRSAHSRTGTASSASTHTHSTAAPPPPSKTPLSPKRSSTTRRLTPSAIPFFRRSSSQSMQASSTASYPKSSEESSSSPTRQGMIHHASSSSVSTSGSGPDTPAATKKSSMLSLLKGSGSRKSLHLEKPPEIKPKEKKEEKERSESRISVLMGRKRGKTVSSTDPKKNREPVPMPPMQIQALPTSTSQRVANLKGSSTLMTPTKATMARTQPSPASQMSKASDASLRSSRHQLPTIAGSPSVGPVTGHAVSHVAPSTSLYASATATANTSYREKDTPTKIPRISGRNSTTSSPQSTHRNPATMTSSRRMSLNNSSMSNQSSNNTEVPPSPLISDFGVIEQAEVGVKPGSGVPTSSTARRTSPSSVSRMKTGIPAASLSSKRPVPRESLSYGGNLRKSSTNSVTSLSTAVSEAPSAAASHTTASSRLSALSPSKIKMLSPKVSLPAPRLISNSATTPSLRNGSPSSGRQSLSTPSPVPSNVDEDEILGDEEMMAYIRRTQARRLASGARQEDLDEMLKFPEPSPPVPPSSPQSLLKSSQAVYLSEYERKEILDYPSVYCLGANSEKKPATLGNPTNNYGYDDERGDYLVVKHDHLAYRYEVIGTLGKGSFGQVLQCRDHATGQSTAIKIIRNKKRFHHQALVEIKILDNLRKWDAEEKHHVIKMTEHFYFRGHLCIAMELLSINLYELIKANGFVGFSTTLIRRFTSQMLASLALMRHHRIVHCDLKPENVLLRRPDKSGIKVIDFGSSCFEHEKVYTYIQSRFYRSPEVILGMNYHMAIDMWSLGCILAELYTGFPIFPGENEQEQLSCIMEVLGVPDKDLINRSSRKKLFFDSTGAPRPVVNSKGRRRKPGTKTLAQVLRCDDEGFVDFIAKCLVWDPERRLKPAPAMRHPFLSSGRKPKPALSAAASVTRSLLSSSSVSHRQSKVSAPVQETPRKSLIGAPTPLTARVSSARAPTTTGVPSTPIATPSNHSNVPATSASHRSYRNTQANSVSYHHSPRANSSYIATKTS